jgi:hypothetical protein
MRIAVKTGIITAFCWITIKLVFHYSGLFSETIVPSVLLNILGMLVSIAIGLYLHKLRSTEETNTLLDIKNAMTAGIPYAVIVSIFIYVYYSRINPEYYLHQIAENEIAIEKMVNDPVALAKFKSEQADAEVMTKEEIETKLKKSNRQGAAPGFTATLSMLALTVLATLYSLLVTIIYRRLIFARRN